MTEKLYYHNQNRCIFRADIVALEQKDGFYHVQLNKTAFYPEGGGQPADRGIINGNPVLDVYEQENRIYHVLNKKPAKKEDVNCEINWERRFDHMQQHTGQHILSAVFNNEYQITTVGFHLGEDYVSIDLNRKANKEMIAEVEAKSNQIIYDNLPVEVLTPDKEDLSKMPLRKEPVVEGDIRVIKIDELDFSPCGGTHLEYTGQVGMIKVLEADNYKDGMRIIFQCGNRARNDYEFKNQLVRECRHLLSVKEEDIADNIEGLLAELGEKKDYIQKLENELSEYRARDMIEQAEKIGNRKIVKEILPDVGFDRVQQQARIITEKDDMIVIMGQKDNNTARIILSRSENIENLDMNEVLSQVLSPINGHGGGTKTSARGGGDNPDGIERLVQKAYEIIKDII